VFSFNSMAAGLASGLSVSTSEPMVVCSKTMRTSIVLTRWVKNGVQKQGDQDFICHYELRDLQCRDALHLLLTDAFKLTPSAPVK
jgi:hypothetical protein